VAGNVLFGSFSLVSLFTIRIFCSPFGFISKKQKTKKKSGKKKKKMQAMKSVKNVLGEVIWAHQCRELCGEKDVGKMENNEYNEKLPNNTFPATHFPSHYCPLI